MAHRQIFVIGFLSLLPMIGCSSAPDPFGAVQGNRLRILASFPPIYCFAAKVAGDHAKVLCLLTTSVHDYQAPPIDSIKAANADLVLINGLGLDDVVTRLLPKSRAKSVLFEVGEALPDDKLIHLSESERGHVHADGSKCTEGDHDPHVWLGPVHAQLMVDAIAKKLGEMRPDQKSEFEQRAAAYKKQLQELHAYGLEKFKAKKSRRVIVTHNFMRYFAGAYQLEIAGNIQSVPGQEAAAGQLAKLCQEKDVHVIIIEPQYSKSSAESLQREFAGKGVNIRLVEIDPLETATAGTDGNPEPDLYIRRMRENIDKLAQALP
jgi:zinc transport system substrate-binding protein